MIEEPNGNGIVNMKLSPSATIPITSSPSNDDLSQSLSTSEYTDADDSMSAPTEYLAEVNIRTSCVLMTMATAQIFIPLFIRWPNFHF